MCLTIPYKVANITGEKIDLEIFGQKRIVDGSMIKINIGDFVLVQNNIIIKKLSRKEAEETLKLFANK